MKHLPWYKKYDEYKEQALKYLKAYLIAYKNDTILEEINSFFFNTIYNIIFESNRIENAGTKTLGETKRIINDYLKSRNINIKKIGILKIDYLSNYDLITEFKDLVDDEVITIIEHHNQIKEARAVINHLNAINLSFIYSFDERDKLNNTDLFTQKRIKVLHRLIAEYLLDDDIATKAGKYRDFDDITIGDTGLIFPSASSLNDCMEEFCNWANGLISQTNENKEDIFLTTAKISHRFVRIHPFPDFNGRVSRLIMNMVLIAFHIPFFVVLRGNANSKHQYLYSLKRADHADYIPYASLLAKRTLETFKNLDENLMLSGLPSLLN
jgi:fido (protein-threonine AMPylation protein)